jgi:hypothetical protein
VRQGESGGKVEESKNNEEKNEDNSGSVEEGKRDKVEEAKNRKGREETLKVKRGKSTYMYSSDNWKGKEEAKTLMRWVDQVGLTNRQTAVEMKGRSESARKERRPTTGQGKGTQGRKVAEAKTVRRERGSTKINEQEDNRRKIEEARKTCERRTTSGIVYGSFTFRENLKFRGKLSNCTKFREHFHFRENHPNISFFQKPSNCCRFAKTF